MDDHAGPRGERRERDPGVGTPLSCLTDFATAFPNLGTLVAEFSYDDALPAADVIWTSFKELAILGIGASRIPPTKVNAIAEFILGVCPSGVQLACYEKSVGNVFDTTKWLELPDRKTLKQAKDLMDFAKRMRTRWDRLSAPNDTPSR